MTASAAGGAPRERIFSRTAIQVGLIAFGFSVLLLGLRFAVVQVPEGDAPPGDRAFVTLYDPPRTKSDTIIDAGDGQAWAALAQDPTFVHPEYFYDAKREFVYRASRPAFPLVVWLGSLGQSALVPLSLGLCTSVGIGLMVAVTAALAERDQRPPKLALITLAFPGTLLVNFMLGPEALAFALAMLGLLLWIGPPRRRGLALALFVVAVLMRDVVVVIPAVLAIWQLALRRDRVRDLLPLALPPLLYAGWVVSLHARYGYWPTQANLVERSAPPFVGFVHAWQEGLPTLTVLAMVLGVVLLFLAVLRRRDSLLTWVAVGFLVPALFFGGNVWVSECYRVLLPAYVLSLVVVCPVDPRGTISAGLRRGAT